MKNIIKYWSCQAFYEPITNITIMNDHSNFGWEIEQSTILFLVSKIRYSYDRLSDQFDSPPNVHVIIYNAVALFL